MKVNVIMPAYNAEKTIVKSIYSVLNQTHKDLRLIVVDDGSTDGTSDLIRMFMGSGKVQQITQKNSGVAEARNAALEMLSISGQLTDFVAFIDSDDVWNPNHLETSLKVLAQDKGDMAYSDVNLVSPSGAPMYAINIAPPQPFNRHQLYLGNFIYISTVVCKAECIKAVGKFDQTLNGLEDWDYWCRLAFNHSFKLSFTGAKTVTYLVRTEGNASSGNAEKVKAIQSKFPNLKELKIQFPMVYDEIFEWNGYGVKSEELVGKTVIDVGANRGFFSTLAKMYGAKQAICFEANPHIYDKLQANFAHDPFYTLVPKAVMSKDGLSLHISDQDGSSSISDVGLECKSVSLATILKQYPDEDLVLKMDVEGAEYDILLNTDPAIVNRFSTIYLEIHTDWMGKKTVGNQVRDYLLRAGFYQAHAVELIAWDQMPDGTRLNVRGTDTWVEKWFRKNIISPIVPQEVDDNSGSDLDIDPISSVKILVMAVCRNEVEIMPHFLNHYSTFADKIWIVDGGSTDGSLQLVNYNPKVMVSSIPSELLNDKTLTDTRNDLWKTFKNDFDWVIVVDMDEFIDTTNLRQTLEKWTSEGVTLAQLMGYQMVSKEFPYDYSKPITDQCQHGYLDEQWLSKMAIFNPKLVEINYEVGCHVARPTGLVKLAPVRVRMFHYKYIGLDYLIDKSTRNSQRLSQLNKEKGFGWHYQAQSKMTEQEFEELWKKSFKVIS